MSLLLAIAEAWAGHPTLDWHLTPVQVPPGTGLAWAVPGSVSDGRCRSLGAGLARGRSDGAVDLNADTLLALGQSGATYALDPTSGRVRGLPLPPTRAWARSDARDELLLVEEGAIARFDARLQAGLRVPLPDVSAILAQPDGGRLWLTRSTDVLALDPETLAVTASFPLPDTPHLAIREDSRRIFVGTPDGEVVEIDTWTQRPVRRTSTGPGLTDLAWSSARAALLVTHTDGRVAEVSEEGVRWIPTAPGSSRIAVAEDGRMALVTATSHLTVLDAAFGRATPQAFLPETPDAVVAAGGNAWVHLPNLGALLPIPLTDLHEAASIDPTPRVAIPPGPAVLAPLRSGVAAAVGRSICVALGEERALRCTELPEAVMDLLVLPTGLRPRQGTLQGRAPLAPGPYTLVLPGSPTRCTPLVPPAPTVPRTGSPPPVVPPGDASRGRTVYEEGLGEGELSATIVDGVTVPAAVVPCAGCHGRDGRGGQEGGLVAPALGDRLRQPYPAWVRGRPRGPYTAADLLRAVREGRDPRGAELVGMPRYTIGPTDAADLASWVLGGIEMAVAPGVSTDTVTLGCLLPLTGDESARGRALEQVLRSRIADLSRQGAVHGRRIELSCRDAPADPQARAQALRAFAAEGRIAAFVAVDARGADRELATVVPSLGVPVVGPLSGPRHLDTPAPRGLYPLVPVEEDLARALVRTALGRPGPTAIVYDETVTASVIAAAVREASAVRVPVRTRVWAGPTPAANLVVLGSGATLAAARRESRPATTILGMGRGADAWRPSNVPGPVILAWPGARGPDPREGYLHGGWRPDLVGVPDCLLDDALLATAAVDQVRAALAAAGRRLGPGALDRALDGLRFGHVSGHQRTGDVGTVYLEELRPDRDRPEGWLTGLDTGAANPG